jgi:tRNA pseudouridine38-40 synthase
MQEQSTYTLAMRVAYKGAAFAGFARQPGLLTVQGELERALEMLLRRPVETTCAGRTDAGVHARGQVVSFEVYEDELAEMDERDAQRARFASFRRSLNAITHDDIAVRSIWQAADGFSARFDAQAREYRYALAVDETPPVFMRDFAWHVGPLDIVTMERASRCLIGEQDFKSFCRASSAVDKPTCRNVMEVSFSEEERFGEQLVIVKVVGSSFLHSMVRTIVGTLVEVGRGRKPESWVAEALAACDRTAAGETAPAQGLVFWEVRYDG